MASTSFARLVTSVMLVFILLQGSSANDHQGSPGARRNLLKDTKTRVNLFQQRGAFSDDNGSKIHGGRKMLIYAGENTGNKELGTPEDLDKDINRIKKGYNGKKQDDSVVGLEAQANEVANLMRRDYKGATGPKKKPPINNHQPNN